MKTNEQRSLFHAYVKESTLSVERARDSDLAILYEMAGLHPKSDADAGKRARLRVAAWGYGCARDALALREE